MKLSVFVVTYNHEKYIQECLDSILMQRTSFPYEVIVGDDDSSDSTRQICEMIAKKHTNIVLLPKEKNLGLIKNWVRVLSHCDGEYVALCEGDDYWIDPFKLQKQVDFLEKNKSFSMSVSWRKVLSSEGAYESIEKKKSYSKNDILRGVIPYTQTMVIRNLNKTELCNYISKLDDLLVGCDRIIAYWCSCYGNIQVLPFSTAVYRWSNEGLWTSYSERTRTYLQIKSFSLFHKWLRYPDRKLFANELAKKCLNFIYYSWRRKQKNPYKFKAIKLLYDDLTMLELFDGLLFFLKDKIKKRNHYFCKL